MTNLELLEVIKTQDELIGHQANLIVKLLNENAEQENFINVLMSDEDKV